jgi:hypothetical protein
MKKTLLMLMAISSLTLPASALDIKAITAGPSADNPQYKNKKAWPGLVGDEYFLAQKWEKTRLLIWAHPGKNPRRRTPLNPMDQANWIDAATGKPAAAIPDMKTDVILPDADKAYKVIAKGGKGLACRHLTVGRNANLKALSGLSVFGNVWVRPSGSMFAFWKLLLVGDRDTFCRQDWPQDGKLRKLHDTRTVPAPPAGGSKAPRPWQGGLIAHFLNHDKPKNSTEMIGYAAIADEFRVLSGTFIVGRDSRFLCGGAAQTTVSKGGRIVLMDGAMHGKSVNQFGVDCRINAGGAITAGAPDRPITRDAHLGVGCKNWMSRTSPGEKKPKAPGRGVFSGYVSGKLIGWVAKDSDARLVVGWHRIRAWTVRSTWGMGGALDKEYAEQKPKITLWLGAAAEIRNVRFDDLHRPGIVLPDASVFKKWKNVSFGPGCLGKDPKEMLGEYQTPPTSRKRKRTQ